MTYFQLSVKISAITLTCVKYKKHHNQLQIVVHALLVMVGRKTTLGLSRWSSNGGSVRTLTRFFDSSLGCGLSIISKLQRNSALYFPYTGEQQKLGATKNMEIKLIMIISLRSI